MEKDIIKVLLDDGSTKDMELVLLYADQDTYKQYVLYKELNSEEECYAAKYIVNNNVFELDPNLTKAEIAKLQLILNSMLEGSR